MIARAGLLLALAAIASGSTCEPSSVEDQRQIRAAFDSYRGAVLAGDGTTAAAQLSTLTANHLGWMRDLALYAPLDELVLHPTVNQLLVMRLRQHVPAEELVRMSGEQVLALVLARGWLGRDVVEKVELGLIHVQGDGAIAELLLGGRLHDWRHLFLREEGRWRFELMQSFPVTESDYNALAMQHGVSGTDLAAVIVYKEAGDGYRREKVLLPLLAESPLAKPAAP